MRIIRKSELKEGRWRNGMGVSWDIASEPPGAEDFGWRFAIARIGGDVPFSHYPATDRIFTLLEGKGLDLDFEGRPPLAVHEAFVPHAYPCDVPTFCRLLDGPCRALNLFMRRGAWAANVEILSSNAGINVTGTVIVHVLRGQASINGTALAAGDTAIAEECLSLHHDTGFVYAAHLTKA